MTKRMTLTLEFDRDVPDDRREMLLTANARALASAIGALDEHLRNRIKYGELGEAAAEELQAARDLIRSELGDLIDPVFG